MLIKIVNGQKKIIAENNKVNTINGVEAIDKNITITGNNIKVGGEGAAAEANISNVLQATGQLVTVGPTGIGSNDITVDFSGHTLTLSYGSYSETANIDIDSSIAWMGLSKTDGSGKFTGSFSGDTDIDSKITDLVKIANTDYLILVYEDSGATSSYTATTVDVSTLIENAIYSQGDGITVNENNIISLKLNETVVPISDATGRLSNVLSLSTDGLSFKIPVTTLENLGAAGGVPIVEGGLYIISNDWYNA